MSAIANQPKYRAPPRLVLFACIAICIFLLPRKFERYHLIPVQRILEQRHSRSSPSRHTKYTVSVCVIVRESSSILPEFIVRNYFAGVDHFFIYGDDTDAKEISRMKQIAAVFQRFMTYLPQGRKVPDDEEDPENYVQMRIYRHCLATFGSHTHWMAFIDSDEFFETDLLHELEPRRSRTGRHAFLHDILMHYDRFPVLCLRWRSAFTNGQLLPAPKGTTLLDHFPMFCKQIVDNKIKLSLRKTIVQPQHVNLSLTAKLDVALHKGFKLRRPRDKFHCVWGLGAEVQPPLYLAHYWSRSLWDYFQKIERGRPREGVPSRTLQDLLKREAVCEPDEKTGVDVSRKDFLRSLGDILKMPEDKPLSVAVIERFMSGTANTEDSTLCTERLRALLYRLAAGYTLSPVRYCEQVKDSPVCSKRRNQHSDHVWPFAWVEFIESCEHELDEDRLFVQTV